MLNPLCSSLTVQNTDLFHSPRVCSLKTSFVVPPVRIFSSLALRRVGWGQDREFPASLDYPTGSSPRDLCHRKRNPRHAQLGRYPKFQGISLPWTHLSSLGLFPRALTPLSPGLRPLRSSKEVSLVITTPVLEALHSFCCQEAFLPSRNPSAAAQLCFR